MINILFTGTAVVLLCFAAYWVRGRGGHRPTGTWAVAALLTSFALAFASYTPAVERAVESVVPHVAGLLSNTFTLTAATSVLAFLFQLNLDREGAHRQIRLRVIALALSVAGMTAFFVAEQLTGRNPVLYACYVLIYISYLGYTAKDFLLQTWAQSKRSTRLVSAGACARPRSAVASPSSTPRTSSSPWSPSGSAWGSCPTTPGARAR